MMQMSFSMDELASPMFAVILIAIGLILACTTLFLAITTVVSANTKTISMMRIFGYSLRECSDAILNGYRPIAYIGFAIGTIYQYALLKMMLSMFSKNVENIPEYNFDVKAFIIVLISFAFIYEVIMFCYAARIKKISIKEIMLK
jgi:putative ABC transport system permease protein